jgi:hypothetical protein
MPISACVKPVRRQTPVERGAAAEAPGHPPHGALDHLPDGPADEVSELPLEAEAAGQSD